MKNPRKNGCHEGIQVRNYCHLRYLLLVPVHNHTRYKCSVFRRQTMHYFYFYYLAGILKFSGLCCCDDEVDDEPEFAGASRFVDPRVSCSVEPRPRRSVEPRTRRSVEPRTRCSAEPRSRCSRDGPRTSCSVEPRPRNSVEPLPLRSGRYSAEMGILLGLGRRLLVGLTDSPSGLVRRILLEKRGPNHPACPPRGNRATDNAYSNT